MLGNGTFGVINLGLAVFSYGLIISSPGLHTIGTRIVSQRSVNDAAVIKTNYGAPFYIGNSHVRGND